MSHQQIIQTLIEWIDDHIDQPLNIEAVAKKSGYSKCSASSADARDDFHVAGCRAEQ